VVLEGRRGAVDSGGGAVVNWSSVGGLRASEQSMATSVYNAAKAGVVSLTKSASAEYGRKGVRVVVGEHVAGEGRGLQERAHAVADFEHRGRQHSLWQIVEPLEIATTCSGDLAGRVWTAP